MYLFFVQIFILSKVKTHFEFIYCVKTFHYYKHWIVSMIKNFEDDDSFKYLLIFCLLSEKNLCYLFTFLKFSSEIYVHKPYRY